jgi:hypothetical protein
MTSENDNRAFELRRAGVSLGMIRDRLEFRSIRNVEAAIGRARTAAGITDADPVAVRDGELDRLDRVMQPFWAKALGGDAQALDRVLRISEMRVRLAGWRAADATALQDALAVTVAALTLTDADRTAVVACERIVAQIDAAVTSGDNLAATKALYLIPHLVNLLRELGATPAARDEVGLTAQARAAAVAEPPVNDLTRFRHAHGIA